MSLFIETLRVENGEIYNIEAHQERIIRTLTHFSSTFSPIDIARQIDFALPQDRHKLRILYSEKGIEEITCTPYTFRLIESLRLVYDDDIDYAFKYADRTHLQALYEQRGRCDDILIVKNGLLTDTSIANIALSDGANWYTPRRPLLHGTKRAELLFYGFVEEADLRVEDLQRFPYIRLLNVMTDWEEWSFPTENIQLR